MLLNQTRLRILPLCFSCLHGPNRKNPAAFVVTAVIGRQNQASGLKFTMETVKQSDTVFSQSYIWVGFPNAGSVL